MSAINNILYADMSESVNKSDEICHIRLMSHILLPSYTSFSTGNKKRSQSFHNSISVFYFYLMILYVIYYLNYVLYIYVSGLIQFSTICCFVFISFN